MTGYTYTIQVSTPSGAQITYSYTKNTGTETFNNSQVPNSSLTYDSGLDFKWIDFSDPEFGDYTLTATIQIDLTGGSQYIYLYLAIITEGIIDQVSLDADIQQTGQNTAVGTANVGFNYFDEYQFIVVIDPILRDGYPRIPRGVTQVLNVKVVSPDPLPSNESITLELITDPGTFGAAVFVKNDGTETQVLQITSSQTITIKGKQHSSKKENIIIRASNKGNVLASQSFSVRTWIKSFVFFDFGAINENLQVRYKVSSESGNISDLGGILLGEFVRYPGSDSTYSWNSPPYTNIYTDNPHIDSLICGVNCLIGGSDLFYDTHKPGDGFQTPYTADEFDCEQFYWFNDTIICKQSERIPVIILIHLLTEKYILIAFLSLGITV